MGMKKKMWKILSYREGVQWTKGKRIGELRKKKKKTDSNASSCMFPVFLWLTFILQLSQGSK